MCEFTVYLTGTNGAEREMVAKNIFAAKYREGMVILLDVMGDSKTIDNVTIAEVSTMKQELVLKSIL